MLRSIGAAVPLLRWQTGQWGASAARVQLRKCSDRAGVEKHSEERRVRWTQERREKELSRIEAALGVSGPADWRTVTSKQVEAAGGAYLLDLYGDSPVRMLRELRPEALAGGERHARAKVSNGYWDEPTNAGELLRSIAVEHNVREVADWRRVSSAAMADAGAGPLLRRHGGKAKLLEWAYATPEASPEIVGSVCMGGNDSERTVVGDRGRESESGVGSMGEGQRGSERKSVATTVVGRKPPGYWEQEGVGREFLTEFGAARGLHTPSDWSGVKAADISAAGGATLLKKYKGSVLHLLQGEMPEGGFTMEEVCRQAPRGHWAKKENCRALLDSIAAKSGIERIEQWQGLTARDLKALGVGPVLHKYGDSVARMLADLYGEEAADVAVVRKVMPKHYWNSRANRIRFLDDLAERLGVDGSPQSWQTVTAEQALEEGASGLLARTNGSLHAALIDAYGVDFADASVSRRSVPATYWQDESRIRNFVRRLESELAITEPEQWMRVSREQVSSRNGGGLLREMPLADALARVYPDRNWDALAATPLHAKKASQRHLCVAVASVFYASAPAALASHQTNA